MVISNQAGELLEDYRLRWKIETLFQAFTGRGFEMEACRLTKPLRWGAFLDHLQALLACLSGRACEAAFLPAVQQLRPMGLK